MPLYHINLEADFEAIEKDSDTITHKVRHLLKEQGWSEVNYELSVEQVERKKGKEQ